MNSKKSLIKEIKLNDVILKNNVFVGPMAGVSDISFRTMMAPFEPGLIYSEMISSKGVVFLNQRTREMCAVNDNEGPVALQLFGNQAKEMVKAAQFIEQETKASVLDINMGCPVNKVVKDNGGASLMKNPALAQELVYQITQNVSLPVTVKMRTGWNDSTLNCIELAQGLEAAGASLISIHGRTREQMYSGPVNYELIKAVKEAVTIPVIGNGDIRDIESARHMMEATGVDGIMMARVALNNPWLVDDVIADFMNKEVKAVVDLTARFDWLKEHFMLSRHYLGEETALKKMKGLSAQFISGLEDGRALKGRFVRMQSVEEFDRIIAEYKLEKSDRA